MNVWYCLKCEEKVLCSLRRDGIKIVSGEKISKNVSPCEIVLTLTVCGWLGVPGAKCLDYFFQVKHDHIGLDSL